MTNSLLPALDPDALLGKSKVFIERAIKRKLNSELDEYQLWASLALELLGKAALAKRHPSLVADPNHPNSLFAAAGINLSTDIKTIQAHTLFDRISKLSPKFDKRVHDFCTTISQRRNAELHSGEAPFRAMKQDAWEAQYWDAAQVILSLMDLSLDEWVGASNAKAPKELIQHTHEVRQQAVKVRVQRAKDQFFLRSSSDQKRALTDASSKSIRQYPKLFTLLSDLEWEVGCPACTGKAFVAGIKVHEEIVEIEQGYEPSEHDVGSYGFEIVECQYSGEQFHCPVCDLALDGNDELEAAGIDTEFEDTQEREMSYEPEYGND